MKWKKLPSWLKGGIIVSLSFLAIYIILVIINFNFSVYTSTCTPSGITRISDWLYPPKYILNRYSPCGMTLRDTIVPGIFWFILGFIIGSVIGKIKKR